MPDGHFFEDAAFDFAGQTVFLDVDGTLAPDNSVQFSPEVMQEVRDLSAKNRVLLCTNKRNTERWRELERILSLPVVTRRHKKPSRRVLEDAPHIGAERIVIGDKFLTDGVFARRIGACFIRVRRKVSGRESALVKLVNIVDDTVWIVRQKLFS